MTTATAKFQIQCRSERFYKQVAHSIVSATTIPGQDVQGTAQVTKSLGLLAQDSLSAIPAELSCGQLGQELFEIKLASTLCFIDNGGGKRFVSGN